MYARQEVRSRSLWICAVGFKLCRAEYFEERLIRLWLSLVQMKFCRKQIENCIDVLIKVMIGKKVT